MATKLQLKNRKVNDSLTVSLRQIKEYLSVPELNAQELLYGFFKGLVDTDLKIHDKIWLLQIVNWTPEKGLPMIEIAKWMKLALRVDALKDGKEGQFTLSNSETKLVWSRLEDPAYRRIGMSPAFMGFMLEFQDASNRWFEGLEPDEEDEEEKSSERKKKR